MKDLPIADRARLHASAALPARQRVALEARGHVDRVHGQRAGQFGRVFDGHAGALRQVRPHGVRGIARQRDQAARHMLGALHRWPVGQRPQAPGVVVDGGIGHGGDQLAQRRAGGAHGARQIGCVGAVVPALRVGRRIAVHNGDHVHPLAAAHRVLHDVQARAQPGGDLRAAQRRGQRRLAQHGAVGQVPGHTRRAVVQQLLAHAAPHAVGAQQRVAFDLLAGHGVQRDHLAVVGVAGQPVVKVEVHIRLAGRRHAQDTVQIGAVDGGVGGAIALQRARAQRQGAQVRAAGGVAHLQPIRESSHGAQFFLQTPGLQDARHVGAELHACPHFGELRRAFVQAHLPPRARRRQRRRQAANATTGNQKLLCCRHAPIVPPCSARSDDAAQACATPFDSSKKCRQRLWEKREQLWFLHY